MPLISNSSATDISTIDAEELIQELNTKYEGTGISFFTFETTEDGVLQAANAYTNQTITANQENLIHVSTSSELLAVVDEMYNFTQEQSDDTPIDSTPSDDLVQAADVTRYATASWYQAACGGGAYYLGGVFCWKNIYYNYTTSNTGYIYGGQVLSSYLSGISVLQWNHHGGWAYRSGSGRLTLNAHGMYVLGFQIGGLPLGATWGDTWVKTVYPPCGGCY